MRVRRRGVAWCGALFSSARCRPAPNLMQPPGTPGMSTVHLPARAKVIVLLGLVVAAPASHAAERTMMVRAITQAGARRVMNVARAAVERLNAPCAIAVVDFDGILVSFDKMDGVRAGSPEFAMGKARTSALLQRPSVETENNVDAGRIAFVAAGFVALRGAMPLVVDGQTVGAVGMASISKDSDVLIATAAAESFATSQAEH